MKSKIFLQLIILCFICLVSKSVLADTITKDEAEIWVNKQGQNLLKSFSEPDIKTRYQDLDNMFLNYVDLDYIGKFVMGKYWRQMTPEQREKFMPLFKRYSMAIYKSFPLDFSMKIGFKVTSVKIDKSYTDVTTVVDLNPGDVSPNKQTFIVSFRLTKNKGQLKIIDLKLAESSLILSYRNRFYEMIKNSGDEIEWFLEDLEMTTVSSEQTNQMRLDGKIE